MKERPILFSGPMVRAILEGQKTQTRRAIKKAGCQCGAWIPKEMPATTPEGWQTTGHSGKWWCECCSSDQDAVTCPYGVPGDRLWVREAFRYWYDEDGLWDCIDYSAGGPAMKPEGLDFDTGMRFDERCSAVSKFCPSIHMPRWASRITLEVTDVRVDRVQDISARDCIAEGIEPFATNGVAPFTMDANRSSITTFRDYLTGTRDRSARASFESLWRSINDKRGYGWDANPWVWVVGFRMVEARP